ncbi:MAG: hypothetical protein AAB834_04865, partial [Patescibacteria group bacterium]
IDWADKIWENAYIMKQFDDNEGIMSSADFGLGAAGKFTLFSLPEIEYHATVFNGTGYKATETNSDKDIALRLNTNLYSDENIGTVVAGTYLNMKNALFNTAAQTKQAALLLAFKNETYGNVYAEYMKGTKINGLSIGGFVYPVPSILPGVGLVARVDSYDPNNTVTTSNDISRSLIGAFYNWGKDVKIAADLQTSKTGSGAETKIAYMHAVVTF